MNERRPRWTRWPGRLGLAAIVAFGLVANCGQQEAPPPGNHPGAGGGGGGAGKTAGSGGGGSTAMVGGTSAMGTGGQVGIGGGLPLGSGAAGGGGQPAETGVPPTDTGGDAADARIAELQQGCVPKWPQPPLGSADPPKAPLARAPRIRWRQKVLSQVGRVSRVVASGNAVATALGALVAVVDKKTGTVKVWGAGASAEIYDRLIGDNQGQFIVGGRQIVALTEAAEPVWNISLPNGGPANNEWGRCDLSFNKARQLVVAGCNDGFVYGIDDSKVPKGARLLWTNATPGRKVFTVEVEPGFGDLVTIVPNTGDVWRRFRVDAASGATVQALNDGAALWAGLAATSQGALTATPSLRLVDRCGKEAVKFEGGGPQLPLVVGVPGERVLVGEGKNAGETLALFSAAGKRLAGPVRTGRGVAAGADGSFYAFSCTGGGDELTLTKPPELIAYDSSLAERWRLPLALPTAPATYHCPSEGVVLDDDGSLYLAVEGPEGTMMYAVETDSPGPAPTPWYVRFADNRGSNWWTD
jgi:hypothetical protein